MSKNVTSLALIQYEGRPHPAFVTSKTFRLLPEEIATIQDAVEAGQESLEAISARDLPELDYDPKLLLAPTPKIVRDILCAGWNYWDHFEEGKGRREGQDVERPEFPTFFSKSPGTIIGPNDPICYDPEISSKWDYEVEVALIIGKQGRNIEPEKALDYIFGYCLANDISQRDLQRAHGGQWLKGKSIDGTMPLGPYITLASSVDPEAIEIACAVNGERVQHASTKLMAFPIRTLMAELSKGMTLYPGDIVLTGTPAGVGNARTPQLFLKDNDRVICSSPTLGTLDNKMKLTDLHTPSTGINRY